VFEKFGNVISFFTTKGKGGQFLFLVLVAFLVIFLYIFMFYSFFLEGFN
jgi:hypothetical protein